jgi:hypothetical protein
MAAGQQVDERRKNKQTAQLLMNSDQREQLRKDARKGCRSSSRSAPGGDPDPQK